jgi:hypothetical protein
MNNYIGSGLAYSDGWAAGKEETLWKIQSELHNAALTSADGKLSPEEIDKVIYAIWEK